MDNELKEQVKNDARRLAPVLIIPPFLASLPFAFDLASNSAMPFIIFVCALVPYSIAALWAYAKAHKDNKRNASSFLSIGAMAGLISGITIPFILPLLSGSPTLLLAVVPAISVGIVLGAMMGFSYAYVFWAYVICKGSRSIPHKLASAIVFLILGVEPMRLLINI